MSPLLRNLIIALIVIAVLFGLDFILINGVGDFQINQYVIRILLLTGVSITLAVSLNLINGFTGQFSLGHAGFMAVGAYSSHILPFITAANGGSIRRRSIGTFVEFFLATIIGALAAAFAGLLVGVPSLRLKGDYLAIVTLGFGQIIVVFLNNIEAVGAARGFSGIPIIQSFFWIFLIAVMTIVIVHNMVKSAFGRALISIREDELAAEAMGVNTTRYKVMAFVISSAMAGAAGVLFAHFDGYLNPHSFEFLKSVEILIMVILGGLGSIVGSILGAIVLTVLPEALRQFAGYRMIIYSLLLIILMITRPQGLLGGLDPFKGWRARRRAKSRTEAEEITAEDTETPCRLRKRERGRTDERQHDHCDRQRRNPQDGQGDDSLRRPRRRQRVGHGCPPRRNLRPHRAERRGQNHRLQLADRRLRADLRRNPFFNKPIHGLRPYQIAARGVSRTFQNIRLFKGMSVLENVMTACHLHAQQNLLDAVLRPPRYVKDEIEHEQICIELLEIFDLADFKMKPERVCRMAISVALKSSVRSPRARNYCC